MRPIVQSATSGHAENIAVTMNSVTDASGHCFAQRLVSVRSQLPTPAVAWHLIGRVRSPQPGSFLHDLAFGLVLIFVLELCLTLYVFYAFLHVFLEVLIIGSSRRLRPSHVLHPIELQNNYLQIH